MLTKRTNLLFDEKVWNLLVATAVEKKTSVGDLVRQAVRRVYIDDRAAQMRTNAIAAIRKNRKIQKRPIDYKALINYGRKYL